MVAAKPAPGNKTGPGNKANPATAAKPASKAGSGTGPSLTGRSTLASTYAAFARAPVAAPAPPADGQPALTAASPARPAPNADEAARSPLTGRTAAGYRAIDSALAGRARADELRGYPRHARSLTARAVRQRILLFASAVGMVIIASVIAAPKIIHDHAPPDPGLKAAGLARTQAAAWVRRWVAPSEIVGCDPLMCRALQAHGVLAAQLSKFNSAAADPEEAEIVVATATVRSQMPTLATVFAPAVIASFGKGDANVTIRMVASDSSAADFERQLRADWQTRKEVGASLLRNIAISFTSSAAAQIKAGNADSRLLILLPGLVRYAGPVKVLGLGGAGPGRSPGIPLMAAYITPELPKADGSLTSAAGEAAMAKAAGKIETFLKAQWTDLRAESYHERTTANGQIVVQVDVSAPLQFHEFNGNPVTTTPIGSSG